MEYESEQQWSVELEGRGWTKFEVLNVKVVVGMCYGDGE